MLRLLPGADLTLAGLVIRRCGGGRERVRPRNDQRTAAQRPHLSGKLGKSWAKVGRLPLGGAAETASDLLLRSLRGQDLNLRPLGYEPSELPDCSTPHTQDSDASER